MIVDDHPLMRDSLVRLIESEADLECCGWASNAEEALEKVGQLKPDLVITDITLPGRSGMELTKDMKVMHPDVAILVFSMHDEMLYAERALRSGARGYLMKEAGSEKLVEAVRLVLDGAVAVSSRLSARIIDLFSSHKPRGSSSPIEKLSDREFEVYQLIGQGKTTKEIAAQLHLSEKTVAVHRGHIKTKLGLATVIDLVRHSVRWTESRE